MKLECLDCGEGTGDHVPGLFWQRQYVRVDFPVNQRGIDRGEEDELVNYDRQLGGITYECCCGSTNVKKEGDL